MSILFSCFGGFLFALTVIRAREKQPAVWCAVGAWAVGSAGVVWSRGGLDLNLLFASGSLAGLAFLGLRFGMWLAIKRSG